MPISIDKLKNGDSLYQIVQTINALIEVSTPNLNILNTLSGAIMGEQVQFTATKDTFITGEVFTISIPGLYQVTAKGKGKSKFAIKHISDGSIETTAIMMGYYVSKEYLLSPGDQVFFWAVGTEEENLTICLSLTGSLFEILARILKHFPEILNQTEHFPPYPPYTPQEGKDGKSAYQSALEGGYMGSEEEFRLELSSIRDRAWADLSNVSDEDFLAKWQQAGVSGDLGISVHQFAQVDDFPEEGKIAMLYVDQSENKAYRWDEKTNQYVVVGSDYLQIKEINGGNANG